MGDSEVDHKVVVEDESGDWRLYELTDPGYPPHRLYRAYHRHGDSWVAPLAIWKCVECKAQAPEAMKGFINLLKWKW